MPADAPIVGLDTATAATAVAATRGGDVLYEAAPVPAAGQRPLHAQTLMAELERAAAASGGWEGVERIAVGVGPGTFTGLRIGISTARALAQGLGRSLVAVGSLASLAAGIGEEFGTGDALLLPVIDARRGEVFAALHDGAGNALWEPCVCSPEGLAARLAELGRAPIAAGDGALRFRAELERAGAEIPPEGSEAHRLAARHVCRLAGDREPVEPREVEPMYLRRPDAELWRERQPG